MARNHSFSVKKAKKVAHAKYLSDKSMKIDVQSNRQKKIAARKAALAKFEEAKPAPKSGVITAEGTTLGGPESHAWSA